MRFTDIFIRRPVFAVSINLLIVLLGIYTFYNMNFRQYPKMTNTVVTVTTQYYGASAELIQGFITQPLEQAIAQADNIDYVTSQSKMGISSINVYMKLNTNPDSALADILSKVNSIRSKLPTEIQDPSLTVSTGATVSLLYTSFTSTDMDSSQITNFLTKVVQPQVMTTQGVASASLLGGSEFAMHIWLNPAKMAVYGFNATDILNVLRENNFQAAPGSIDNYFIRYSNLINTQVNDVWQLRNLIIRTNADGSVIRLSNIATVQLTKNRDTARAYAEGKNAVILAIDPTPSANPLEVVAAVKDVLLHIERSLPSAIKMRILYDSTEAINESIYEVIKTIVEAIIIVILVITLFMGSLRSVMIPVVTIPLSLLGAAILMNIFDLSFNLLTLLAMVLAIGLVVDDAIVVVENTDRHIKNGESPFIAAIKGAREIALPVISMTITLIAVYTPIVLTTGITGSLFKEFALTLAGAVFVSGIIALTLSPVMCSALLRQHTHPGRFESAVIKYLDVISVAYQKALNAVMKHKQVLVVFSALVFIALPCLLKFIPAELAPVEDNNFFMLMAKAPENANLDYVQAGLESAIMILNREPEVETSVAFAGFPDSNQGFAGAILTPSSKRKRSQKEIIASVSKIFADDPVTALSAFPMPTLPGGSGGFPVQFIITTTASFENLLAVATKINDMVKQNPDFIFSQLDLNFGSATIHINIDRNKAGAYGITMKQIAETLSTMMGNGYINKINLSGRAYEVIPQVKRKFRFTPESIEKYYVRAASGQMIPLKSIVSLTISGQPRTLNHLNQMNSANIGIVPAPGTTIGQAVDFLKMKAAPLLPQGYQYDFLGEARQYVQEGNTLFITFLLALCIIFLVLAAQFESMRDPLVIMISVPLAISGALVFMAWGLTTMNIYTQVGLITLIGLITRHGILICEVAKNEQILHGKSRTEAVIYAANLRLRPVLMTTISMIAGLLPLLFAKGPGAVSRFDIGLIILSGLSIGTLFTLFVLPVIYTLMASKHKPLPKIPE
ncbi:MAG: efflux RND transporter permease subunit [Endozoicomonadaceae bacterium]|nr:efflux RND transporter permease subunit [Endozoicomonadaceae bacterium]